ncbi:hypothetical protein ZWY2020_025514 [Hordeum vulgare]|nr:hypothetical protein ZWY2020_025514 [Hordeum vulgare]
MQARRHGASQGLPSPPILFDLPEPAIPDALHHGGGKTMTPSFLLAGSGRLQRGQSSASHLTSKANADTGGGRGRWGRRRPGGEGVRGLPDLPRQDPAIGDGARQGLRPLLLGKG